MKEVNIYVRRLLGSKLTFAKQIKLFKMINN